MNSRRKFIVQGGLATTALLAAKPFSAIAKAANFTSSATSRNFVLLHTAHMHSCSDAEIVQYISSQKNSAGAILATAGNKVGTCYHPVKYDITPHATTGSSVSDADYSIIQKGNIKTGVIVAIPGDHNVIEKMKSLSEKLKAELNCQVVVCLSQLGYKNGNKIDDRALAAASTHLDIIIGGHPANFAPHPMIARNKLNGEVIIHAAPAQNSGCGKIEIEFDEQGRKKFLNLSSKVA